LPGDDRRSMNIRAVVTGFWLLVAGCWY